MFLTGAFLNLSINKPRIYKRNVFFLFSSLPSPRSSTVSHLLVQLWPSAGQNLSLIPLENANHHNKWFAFYNICLGKNNEDTLQRFFQVCLLLILEIDLYAGTYLIKLRNCVLIAAPRRTRSSKSASSRKRMEIWKELKSSTGSSQTTG